MHSGTEITRGLHTAFIELHEHDADKIMVLKLSGEPLAEVSCSKCFHIALHDKMLRTHCVLRHLHVSQHLAIFDECQSTACDSPCTYALQNPCLSRLGRACTHPASPMLPILPHVSPHERSPRRYPENLTLMYARHNLLGYGCLRHCKVAGAYAWPSPSQGSW
jgi:hypothetical protein